MLVDLIGRELTGKDAEAALGAANITINKNAVPGDPRSPFVTSGIRLGTPAITTRGFGVEETRTLGRWIAEVLDHPNDDAVLNRIKGEVLAICRRFPVYGAD
jgi:glycine hydroxymethyltransferase